MPTKGKLGAVYALIAFEPPDTLPIMEPRQYTAAQRERFTASFVYQTKVMFHPAGDQLHISHTVAHWYHYV